MWVKIEKPRKPKNSRLSEGHTRPMVLRVFKVFQLPNKRLTQMRGKARALDSEKKGWDDRPTSRFENMEKIAWALKQSEEEKKNSTTRKEMKGVPKASCREERGTRKRIKKSRQPATFKP